MNQTQVKTTIPKHIDPREIVKTVPTADVINMSNMMKASGNNPYRYVRAAFKKLAENDFDQASRWLDEAQLFEDVFYTGKDSKSFKDEMILIRATIYFLTDRFKDLKPEE